MRKVSHDSGSTNERRSAMSCNKASDHARISRESLDRFIFKYFQLAPSNGAATVASREASWKFRGSQVKLGTTGGIP
eukprot:scaffold1857_cov247-Pinguiococcus_pyrenoidosus.AAC.3